MDELPMIFVRILWLYVSQNVGISRRHDDSQSYSNNTPFKNYQIICRDIAVAMHSVLQDYCWDVGQGRQDMQKKQVRKGYRSGMASSSRNASKDGFAIKLVRRIHSEVSVGSLGIGRNETWVASTTSVTATTPTPTVSSVRSSRTRTRSHSHPNFESGFRWIRNAEDTHWNWPNLASSAVFSLEGNSHSTPINADFDQIQSAKKPVNSPSAMHPNRNSVSQDSQTPPPPPPPNSDNYEFTLPGSVTRASRDARPKHRRTNSVHHESIVFPLAFPNHGFKLSGG
ncbi:hypothetical protein HK100_004175 [Physocladia obscura]|uniref:Uncharacterized protein n=1 Tax=Physocladia obscura TaxID=109957 RepID=A0AAD5XMQ8_9FUNG|nr:hypothetical protein HK100_004175 [Physocladia obscura]